MNSQMKSSNSSGFHRPEYKQTIRAPSYRGDISNLPLTNSLSLSAINNLNMNSSSYQQINSNNNINVNTNNNNYTSKTPGSQMTTYRSGGLEVINPHPNDPSQHANLSGVRDLININQSQILSQNIYSRYEEAQREEPIEEPPIVQQQPVRPPREKIDVDPLVLLGDKNAPKGVSEKELLNEFELMELIKSNRQDESQLKQILQSKLKPKVQDYLPTVLYNGFIQVRFDRLLKSNKGFQQFQFHFGLFRKSTYHQEKQEENQPVEISSILKSGVNDLSNSYLQNDSSLLKSNESTILKHNESSFLRNNVSSLLTSNEPSKVQSEVNKNNNTNNQSQMLRSNASNVLNSNSILNDQSSIQKVNTQNNIQDQSFGNNKQSETLQSLGKSISQKSFAIVKRNPQNVINNPKTTRSSKFYKIESSNTYILHKDQFSSIKADKDWYLFIEVVGYTSYMAEIIKQWTILPLFNEKNQLIQGRFRLPFYSEHHTVASLFEKGQAFSSNMELLVRITLPDNLEYDNDDVIKDDSYRLIPLHDHSERGATHIQLREIEERRQEQEKHQSFAQRQRMAQTIKDTQEQTTKDIIDDVSQSLYTLQYSDTPFIKFRMYRKPNKNEVLEQWEIEKNKIKPELHPNKTIRSQHGTPSISYSDIQLYKKHLDDEKHIDRLYKYQMTKMPHGYYSVSPNIFDGFDASRWGQRFVPTNRMSQDYKNSAAYQDYVQQFNENYEVIMVDDSKGPGGLAGGKGGKKGGKGGGLLLGIQEEAAEDPWGNPIGLGPFLPGMKKTMPNSSSYRYNPDNTYNLDYDANKGDWYERKYGQYEYQDKGLDQSNYNQAKQAITTQYDNLRDTYYTSDYGMYKGNIYGENK